MVGPAVLDDVEVVEAIGVHSAAGDFPAAVETMYHATSEGAVAPLPEHLQARPGDDRQVWTVVVAQLRHHCALAWNGHPCAGGNVAEFPSHHVTKQKQAPLAAYQQVAPAVTVVVDRL